MNPLFFAIVFTEQILSNLFYLSYFIGNQINELDRRIKKIQLPKLVRRNLRPLSEREYYKAHEWRVILLFIACPILTNILPERFESIAFYFTYLSIILMGKIKYEVSISFERL